MIAAPPNESYDPRAKRMIAALVEGADLEAAAAQERLPAKEAQTILSDELGQRWVAPPADFAKIQIARLEYLCLHVMDRIDSGELAAVDRALRIIDRLDRYHGFSRGSATVEPYGEEERTRLIAKLNAVAARLSDDEPERRSE
jgi:hypothetical protein